MFSMRFLLELFLFNFLITNQMNGMISRSLMGVFGSACFSVMNAQDRPNIVVFIVDDMG